jgi:hypothetical protein
MVVRGALNLKVLPMKLAQRKIKWLARLVLGLVLFAQGIVAANACVAPSASPVQAYAAVSDDEALPCHEEERTNANACLTHCTQSDRISVDQHTMPPAAPLGVIARVVSQPQIQRVRPVAPPESLSLNTGPPLSIRFCSFLI